MVSAQWRCLCRLTFRVSSHFNMTHRQLMRTSLAVDHWPIFSSSVSGKGSVTQAQPCWGAYARDGQSDNTTAQLRMTLH
jgi:hypothetical protein